MEVNNLKQTEMKEKNVPQKDMKAFRNKVLQ